jgi:hypothetical protein
MAGYVREDGGPLEDLAETLGRALLQHNLASLSGAAFGTRVEQPRSIAGVAEALDWEASAPTTCLAGPIGVERAASKTRAALFVLITDGVVAPSAGTCGAKCADADQASCVGQALFEYLQSGNGLWVTGVRIPYAGHYYTARESAPLAVPFARRPIYVWIGGPNVEVGRAVTEWLVEWAVNRQPPLDHVAIEIWPGRWDEPVRVEAPRRSTLTAWSAQHATDAIARWSTTDDTDVKEITKTLGFEPLWGQLIGRLDSIRRTLR